MSLITVGRLSHTYPDGIQALTDISFRVEKGERIALVGANGAGKSTLLLRLAGLMWGVGELELEGIQVNKTSIGRLRSKIGITFQNPDDQLFCPTILDDIAYGLLQLGRTREEALVQSQTILETLDLVGYEKRPSFNLSIGERRRAALATVLVMSPQLLLLDEPSAFLDPRGKHELISILENLTQTIILATHDLELARRICERTIVMDKGSICADGNTDALMGNKQLMKETGLEVPYSLRTQFCK